MIYANIEHPVSANPEKIEGVVAALEEVLTSPVVCHRLDRQESDPVHITESNYGPLSKAYFWLIISIRIERREIHQVMNESFSALLHELLDEKLEDVFKFAIVGSNETLYHMSVEFVSPSKRSRRARTLK